MSRTTYTFNATQEDGEVVHHQFVMPEGIEFPVVAQRFLTFLSCVYGYDLHPSVAIVEPLGAEDPELLTNA